LTLSSALSGAGEKDKALAAYDKGIQSFPKNPAFRLGKAKTLIEMKKYEEATVLLNKILETNPERMDVLETLAYTYRDMGKMKEANEAAQKILARNKNHARVRIIAADYKRISGKLDEALADYQLAAKSIETKAYAEHFISVIKQQLDEAQIEKEYEESLKKK
jgi:predicted Zn-dependent protease